MTNVHSLFTAPWTELAPGIREKRAVLAGQVVRLLEHASAHVEAEYCQKAHAGLVLEGSATLEFQRGGTTPLSEGDALVLRGGAEDAHRVTVKEGGSVLFLLVEPG